MSTTDDQPSAVAVPTPAGMRASDAERDTVVAALYRALADGRLDVSETDTRVTRAYAASHRTDLGPLLHDLPGEQPAPATAPIWSTLWATFWVGLAWRARAIVVAVALGLVLIGGAAGAALGDSGGPGIGHHQHDDLGPAAGR